MLLIGAMVRVSVVVVDGTITVTLTVPVCVTVVAFDCAGLDPKIVLKVSLPVLVTRGMVVRLKEGKGVKMAGNVMVVEV